MEQDDVLKEIYENEAMGLKLKRKKKKKDYEKEISKWKVESRER